MRSARCSPKGNVLILWFLALALIVPGLQPPPVLAEQQGPVTSLQTFNQAALNGDLETVQHFLSRRFLTSTSFFEEKRRNPSQLRQEVRLLSFYNILAQEPLPGPTVRVKVVQHRLVGRGLVTRWYYLVQEDNRWKVDSIGEEEPYQ